MKHFEILGVKIHDVSLSEAVEAVISSIQSGSRQPNTVHDKKTVFTVNPEFILEAQTNAGFREILNGSFLNVPDGNGVIFAKNYLEKMKRFSGNSAAVKVVLGLYYGVKVGIIDNFCSFLPGKSRENFSLGGLQRSVPGVDLALSLLEEVSLKRGTVFLVGTRYLNGDSSSDQARDVIATRFEGIKLIGSVDARKQQGVGSFGDIPTEEVRTEIERILSSHDMLYADIVLVGLGHPRQEYWISKNSDWLPGVVFVGVGGTFDFLRGAQKRAPYILRQFRMEWAYRLLSAFSIERLSRIIKAVIIFPIRVYLSSIN